MRVAVELARRKSGDLPEFERLDDDAERLDALIGQILSYTKLEADREQGEEKVELLDVVNEVTENVNFECEGERVSVTNESGGDTTVAGHRGALVSAVENIVRNAVRHSPPDKNVGIAVSSTNRTIKIEITDHGPGVAEEDLPHLFDPFFRTRASAEQDSNGGTGLGLAIARRAIVDLHGGQLTATNGADRGLTVSISLGR